ASGKGQFHFTWKVTRNLAVNGGFVTPTGDPKFNPLGRPCRPSSRTRMNALFCARGDSRRADFAGPVALFVLFLSALPLAAQNPPAGEQVVELSPFQVSASSADRYR